MSVEEIKLDVQCQCGSNYMYSGEAIYTSPLKYIYCCESCSHEIYVIKQNKEGKDYDSHMGYRG